jgi:hypothetical protein
VAVLGLSASGHLCLSRFGCCPTEPEGEPDGPRQTDHLIAEQAERKVVAN